MKKSKTLLLVSLAIFGTPVFAQNHTGGYNFGSHDSGSYNSSSSGSYNAPAYRPYSAPTSSYGGYSYSPPTVPIAPTVPTPNSARLDRYGAYGGAGHTGGYSDNGTCGTYWGKPVDAMDNCFKEHDYSYIRSGSSAFSPMTPEKREADRTLVNCLDKTEVNGFGANAYKQAATMYFTGPGTPSSVLGTGHYIPPSNESYFYLPPMRTGRK